jgi:predicted nucleic acid-binding protein
VLVRATVPPIDGEAVDWLLGVIRGRVTGHAPHLVYAETANAVRGAVHHGRLTPERALRVVDYVVDLPLVISDLRTLAHQALSISVTGAISAYDAFYIALARGLDATLVTADRRLAEHHDRVALLA